MEYTMGRFIMTPEVKEKISLLEKQMNEHSFWDNKLFQACKKGDLTFENWRYIFGQYYIYNKNFTRYLSALMVNCDNDYYRATLSANLWEEGGGRDPEERHAEMFRSFLINTLMLDLDKIEYHDFSKHFAYEYLNIIMKNNACYGSSFLSLGTEGIVARMYGILVEGMLKAGINQNKLGFFELHMECDDEHAETLAEMMASYYNKPHWFDTCQRAMEKALAMRERLFNNLYDSLWLSDFEPIGNAISGKKSLFSPESIYVSPENNGSPVYENIDKAQNIEFYVDRANLPTQVLDPRKVRIPPGKNNEVHSHAHETVMYFLQGEGSLVLDGKRFKVKAGDIASVPRWSNHQTINDLNNEDLVYLGITDSKLATKFTGNSESYYRQNDNNVA